MTSFFSLLLLLLICCGYKLGEWVLDGVGDGVIECIYRSKKKKSRREKIYLGSN